MKCKLKFDLWMECIILRKKAITITIFISGKLSPDGIPHDNQ
jgi:hypothetical protein